jgi:hypothetical protein
MAFGKVKIDANDTLYSRIIRFGHRRCPMCRCARSLQCAHIVGRRPYSTRFLLKPKPNAIPLCMTCHDWFDTHKIKAVVFDEKKRVFKPNEESFTFLVKKMGYSWNDILIIFAKSQQPFTGYSYKKTAIKALLTAQLNSMETKRCKISYAISPDLPF